MRSKSIAVAEFALDRDLLRNLKETSKLEQTVSEFFKLLRGPVNRYVITIIGDPAEAEDVTQEVFLHLYSRLRKGGRVDNCRGWVFRVAYNLAMDILKKKKKLEFLDPDSWERASEDPGPDAEQRLLRQEEKSQLGSAWGRLSPQERHCLNLRAEGLRYREIAAVLGVRSSSVGNFLARGIAKIIKETHE